MDDLIQTIFRTIEEYHMIEPGMRVIAGVSGGADSVCLLYALRCYRRKVPFELLVVHVEHGLRGRESLEDAEFVEQLCAGWKLPCRVAAARVRQRADMEGLSIEEAARAERYRIFEETGREWNADRIAVAHNRNDQAETVLWNLARGSSLKGLGGIRPVQGNRIRPLLFTERKDIEDCLQRAGLLWRTDRTNLETEYTRNRIRLSLLPQMERDLNPQASRHIAEAADRLRDVQDYIDRMTDEAAGRCIAVEDEDTDETAGRCIAAEGESADQPPQRVPQSRIGFRSERSVVIRLEAYKKEERLIRQELLRRALQLCADGNKKSGLKNIGAVHIHMLEELTDMDCGKRCDLPGGIRVVREDGILRFLKHRGAAGMRMGSACAGENSAGFALSDSDNVPETDSGKRKAGECAAIELPVPGQISPDGIAGSIYGGISVTTELMPNSPELKKCFLEEKKYTKWISYDTIKDNLLFRTRQPGDYLVVNAEGGKKKLKDYLIDQKIPRDKRDRILLLADGSHILWAVGWRLSEAAKVTDETRQVLKIALAGDGIS
ncbi:MAG: tRNA lysidine(34) synthetase TilS [Lachnospiraceae bacterium]|nr:tRNA lysidine(34) synthetase TilS [Lachnospiraceae bacterium]MCD7766257.1 tRNA lysidine(34) synthetase TilS [Lachnospiraceae bacterium]